MPYLARGGADAFKKNTKKNLGAGIKVSGSNLVPVFEALQHYEAVMGMDAQEQCKAVCAVLSKCNNWYIKKNKKLTPKKKTETAAKRSQVVGAVMNEAIGALRNYDPTFYRAVQNYHVRKASAKLNGAGAPQTKTMAAGYVNERVAYLSFNKQTSMAAGFVHEAIEKDPKSFLAGSPRRQFQTAVQSVYGTTKFEGLTPDDWVRIHATADELDQQKISVRYMKKFERMSHMLEGDGNGGLRYVVGARSAQGDGWPWAMDEWGSIYTADHKLDANKAGKKYFNHSTFTGGDVVVCAGELTINGQGTLLSINNASGHYQPTGDHLRAALTILRDDYGVSFAAVEVSAASKDTMQVWNSGDTFLNSGLPNQTIDLRENI